MVSKLRRRKPQVEDEAINIFESKLSTDNFILNENVVVFTNLLPQYDSRIKLSEIIEEIYNNFILEKYENTISKLSEQRDKLKNLIKETDNNFKIPKTPIRGKNVSKIAKLYETIELRKDKMVKKNLFSNNDVSFGDQNVGSVAYLRSKFNDATNNRTTKNVLHNIKKRNTTERQILRIEQANSIQRADQKKQCLLKQKAEKVKHDREEKAKQVEERRRLKEMEHEKKLKALREDQINETQNKTPNRTKFKTPISSVSRLRINTPGNIIYETPIHEIERKIHTKIVPDKSCKNSEIYETPILRKRKSSFIYEENIDKNIFMNNENVTPNIRDNDILNSYSVNNIKKVEISNNVVSMSLQSSKLFNDSVSSVVNYGLTPDKVIEPSTEDDYNIADLSEGDGTDDEDNPRKTIPSWARTENLKISLSQQYRKYKNFNDIIQIFGKHKEFKFDKVFNGKKYDRTSSAFWSSPLSNPRKGNAVYYQLSESIVDNSF
uniref:INCENP_ARK-bind domain-containing protein n=1 Tax=Parastrongyloides trichosuri TaxID=131310 RepID=A0A0N4ZWP4_PARTI